MSDAAISLLVLSGTVGLFLSNRLPVEWVALLVDEVGSASPTATLIALIGLEVPVLRFRKLSRRDVG